MLDTGTRVTKRRRRRRRRRRIVVAAAVGLAWLVQSAEAQTTGLPSLAPSFAPIPDIIPGNATRAPSGSPSANATTLAPSSSPTASPIANSTTLAPSGPPTGPPTKTLPNVTRSPSSAPSRSPASAAPSTSPSRSPSTPVGGGAPGKVDGAVWCPDDTDGDGAGGRWVSQADARADDAPLYLSYALAGATVALGLCGAAFVYAYRARPIIKISQREFLVLFSAGFAVLGGSLVPLIVGVEAPSRALCVAHDVLFNAAAIFIMASILVKEWRAWLVFDGSRHLRRVHVSNARLFGYMAALLAVPAALIVLNASGAAGEPRPEPCNGFRCASTPFGFAIYAYELLLAAATVLMALRARTVPSVGGEAAGILYTAFFTAFALLLVGIMFVSGAMSPVMEALLLALSVFWSCCLALGTIVFRKAWWLASSKDEVYALFVKNGTGTGTGAQSQAQAQAQGQGQGRASSNGDGRGSSGDGGPASGATAASALKTGDTSDGSGSLADDGPGPGPVTASLRQATSSSTAATSPSSAASAFARTGLAGGALQHPVTPRSTATNAIELLGADNVLVRSPTSGSYIPISVLVSRNVRSQSNSQSSSQSPAEKSQTSEWAAGAGWKVGSRQGWDEFLDRSTGEAFWVNQATSQVVRACPFTDDEVGACPAAPAHSISLETTSAANNAETANKAEPANESAAAAPAQDGGLQANAVVVTI